MEVRDGLYYTKEHEWLKVEDGIGIIGITDFAQSELGDIVFIELPEVGEEYEQNAQFGVIESVKAASDIYMPIAGKVIEINEELEDAPELINKSPYDDGWIIKVEIKDTTQLENLLSAEQYKNLIEE